MRIKLSKEIQNEFKKTYNKKNKNKVSINYIVNTINALLSRKDPPNLQLNKLIMILQENNMFNESSVLKLAEKSKIFKQSIHYITIYSLVSQNNANYNSIYIGIIKNGFENYTNYMKFQNEKIIYKGKNKQNQTKMFYNAGIVLWKNRNDWYDWSQKNGFEVYSVNDVVGIDKGRFGPITITSVYRSPKYDTFTSSKYNNPYENYIKHYTKKYGIGSLKLLSDILNFLENINKNFGSSKSNKYTNGIFSQTYNWFKTTYPKKYKIYLNNMISTIFIVNNTTITSIINDTNNYYKIHPIIVQPETTIPPPHMMTTTMHPDHMMTTTMHPDHMMGTTNKNVGKTVDGEIELPGGSWIHSAKNYSMTGTTLYAQLENEKGSYNTTSVQVIPGATYANINGNFVLSGETMRTTIHPDHMMGTYPTHHSLETTMYPDHMMEKTMYPDHMMEKTMYPDHMMETTMYPDHMMGITISPDHIYDHELNNDLLTIQQKMRRKIKSEIFNELEEDIEEDIERQEKILQSLENYNCPCQEPQLEMLKQTCHPLTSHKTTSFEMAKNIRTPYDKHWLKIYNGRVMNENFCLTNLKSIP